MSTLSQAPLIEVIFELRWGVIKEQGGQRGVEFPPEEEFFLGQFHGMASKAGFGVLERVNTASAGIPFVLPHIVTHRFRKQAHSWPCYQVGMGVFAANQLNAGYDWHTFKADVLQGLRVLDEGHPLGLRGLPPLGLELRYQDGFTFKEGQGPLDFLREALTIGFHIPDAVTKAEQVEGTPETRTFSFQLDLSRPKAKLITNLRLGHISGKRGYIMDTMVRAADASNIERFDFDYIAAWIEEAHEVQRLAFKSFIQPAFAKSLT